MTCKKIDADQCNKFNIIYSFISVNISPELCTNMKQPLQQLLDYPYEVMHAHVKLVGCAQHGNYDKHSHECHLCPDRKSCIWVNEVTTDDIESYSDNRQMMLLEHAMDSMMSYAHLLEHDVKRCSCTNCQWIRRAMNTYNDYLIDKVKN